MAAKNDKVKDDIFEDDVVETEEVEMPDDLKEGIIAEIDPQSKIPSKMDMLNKDAEDIVAKRAKENTSNIGRETFAKLNKSEKLKVLVPKNRQITNDEYTTFTINGATTQVAKDKPVMIPIEGYELLANAGENPTLVR